VSRQLRESGHQQTATLLGDLMPERNTNSLLLWLMRGGGGLFTGASFILFSLFSTAFQLPLVCVPACQLFTFALAHVHFQFVSNSAAFSPTPCFQQAENEGAIRRSRVGFEVKMRTR